MDMGGKEEGKRVESWRFGPGFGAKRVKPGTEDAKKGLSFFSSVLEKAVVTFTTPNKVSLLET